ncbi:MAG: glycosyltransferase [Bacteroidota bacterium]
MKLSIVIVNYNVKYFLEQALLAVRKACKGLSSEVFVVDNNSVDDSVSMVREKFPEVHLIANEDNPGFSIANNQAIRQSKGEYVLLLNPDTVVEEDTFTKCVAFMDEHLDAGGLGVRMIDGSGKFLPESKRGFPSPFVAFCKTFGLSSLFPKSRVFNRYHLGFLDANETNEVDVLAGAFMLLRKSVLDEIGLLDESFFMYGEDIDLSYRIVQAGYKNYYFADTTIIHYKGESTKKGSLNYVKAFYNAMIIFARKHFKGESARLYVFMLQMAIYFRAFLTIISNFFRRAYLPILDAAVIFAGLYVLKDFWATNYFNNPDYYQSSFVYFNMPLYIGIWLTAVYFSGGYDHAGQLRRLARGLLVGTLLLAAVYGFLDLEYRSSRALIILGAIWALLSTIVLRLLLHFMRYQNFNLGREHARNLVVVGSEAESKRVMQLVHQAHVFKNCIGFVAPFETHDPSIYLSSLKQLDEVVHIYKVEEIIFCSRDISSQQIMQWMTRLGPQIDYKIVPEESLSIIGSSSKNTAGELYTIDIRFQIADSMSRRNKRLLDILVVLVLVGLLPIALLLVKQRLGLLQNILAVLLRRKSWVGYAPTDRSNDGLPTLRQGILSPLDALELEQVNMPTIKRLNFLYAKDYQSSRDLEIIWLGRRFLGRQ